MSSSDYAALRGVNSSSQAPAKREWRLAMGRSSTRAMNLGSPEMHLNATEAPDGFITKLGVHSREFWDAHELLNHGDSQERP